MNFLFSVIELVWIQLSGSEVALGIVSIVVGIYITMKTNQLKTDSLYKRNIRLSLWGYVSILVGFIIIILEFIVHRNFR